MFIRTLETFAAGGYNYWVHGDTSNMSLLYISKTFSELLECDVIFSDLLANIQEIKI